MRILIIGTMYEPDLGPDAPLFTMLSKELVKRGHQVVVIAMVPHYPSGQVSAAFRGKWIQRSIEQGVEVIRIGLPSVNRSRLPLRFLQFLCYQIGALFACTGQKYDVVLALNPFLTVLLPFIWSVVIRKKAAVFSVNDLYPDVGIRLGIFKHKLVISAAASLERFCLTHSTIVQVISDSFRPGLHALGVPEAKIELVNLWVDTDLIRPSSPSNGFTREYGLDGHFIVMYAGNLGLTQGLEQILSAAELLAEQKDIRFVFVGDGAGREFLKAQAAERRLENVNFIPLQPRERLPEVLLSADLSMVMLRKGMGLDSLPSKTFSIMASGRPILASVDGESATSKLISKSEAGVCVPPEDPEKLVSAILNLKSNPVLRTKLGNNGRLWVEMHHSPQKAAEQFEKLFVKAISIYGRPAQ